MAILADALARDFAVHILMAEAAPQHFPVAQAQLHRIPLTRDGILAAVDRLGIDLVLDHYHWDQGHVRLMADLAQGGLPVVMVEHNAFHYPLFKAARDPWSGFEGWFTARYDHYRRFAAVVVLNQTTLHLFSQHLDNLRCIPNPVPDPAMTGRDLASRRLLTVSHFGKKAKRLDRLYQAFAQLWRQVPEASLTVLGDYDLIQDRWLRLAFGLEGAQVRTPGRSGLVDLHYGQSALFGLTSEIEGQPMVLLEAARHGIPQIAFDLPGLEDQLIHDETGLLVPQGDTGAFGDAAASLISDTPRLRRMGDAARDLVRRDFSLTAALAHWRRLISDIAAQGRIRSESPALSPKLQALDLHWQDHWQAEARHPSLAAVPKVSFLVPVFGTEELLGRCLRSIRDQSLTEFECIVVDDASPGDAAAAMAAAIGHDPRFRLIRHPENRGIYQTRSTAARAARGLYFAHVDSDDYIHPRFAEILFAEALTTGAEIVECKAIELLQDGRPVRFNEVRQDGPQEGARAARAFFGGRLRNVLWNKLYARALWDRVPDHMQIDTGLSVGDDLLRNALIFPHCRRYSAVADCLYFYCRRPVSVVKGGDLVRLRAKLGDIDFAYATAQAHLAGPDQAWARAQLQAARAKDVTWYLTEYLQRSPPDLPAAIGTLGPEADAALSALMLAGQAGAGHGPSGRAARPSKAARSPDQGKG